MKSWFKAATIRAIKTIAQTAVATIGAVAINAILADITSFGIGIQATLNQIDYPIVN